MNLLSKSLLHAFLCAKRLIDRFPHLIDIHYVLGSQLMCQLKPVRLAVFKNNGLIKIFFLRHLDFHTRREYHTKDRVNHINRRQLRDVPRKEPTSLIIKALR